MMKFGLLFLISFSTFAQFDNVPSPYPGVLTNYQGGNYGNPGFGSPGIYDPNQGLGYDSEFNGNYSGRNRTRPLNINSATVFPACSFNPQINADEAALLTNVKNALATLESSEACRPLATRYQNAYQEAINSYQQTSGINNAPGMAGNVAVQCSNYNDIFQQEYDYFLAIYHEPVNGVPKTFSPPQNYADCTYEQTKVNAATCAAIRLADLKTKKQNECKQFENGTAATQAMRLRLDGTKQAIDVLNQIVKSDCVDALGEQKAGFFQSVTALAGRSLTIGMNAGSLGTVLVGGAASLMETLVGNFFKDNNRATRELLIKKENFSELACMYEEVEKKANRCDRALAEAEVRLTEQAYGLAQSCLTNPLGATQDIDGFISMLQRIQDANRAPAETSLSANPSLAMAAMQPAGSNFGYQEPSATQPSAPVAPPEFGIQELRALRDQLRKPAANSNGQMVPFHEVLSSSAKSLKETIPALLQNESALRDFMIKGGLHRGPASELGDQALGSMVDQLRSTLAFAEGLEGLIPKIMGLSVVSMTADDALKIKTEASFFGNKAPVSQQISSLLVMASSLGSQDIPSQANLFMQGMGQSANLRSVVDQYVSKKQQVSQPHYDNGLFETARLSLMSYLREQMREEQNRLWREAEASLKVFDRRRIFQGGYTKSQLQEMVETKIFPLARMCNQLRTAATDSWKPTEISPDDFKHESCRKFNCSGGIGSFKSYLLETGRNARVNNNRCVDANCGGYYSEFLCREQTRMPNIRDMLMLEFTNQGTVCGVSPSEWFR